VMLMSICLNMKHDLQGMTGGLTDDTGIKSDVGGWSNPPVVQAEVCQLPNRQAGAHTMGVLTAQWAFFDVVLMGAHAVLNWRSPGVLEESFEPPIRQTALILGVYRQRCRPFVTRR